MAVWENVIIPIIQLLFYFLFFGFISFIIGRAMFISWNKTWKWVIKYKIKKQPFTRDEVELVTESLKTLSKDLFRMNMLSAGLSTDKTNELCFIYDEIKRKGGV